MKEDRDLSAYSGDAILGELGKFHWQLDEIRKNLNSIEFNIKALFTICKDLGENTAELGNLSSFGNEKVLINKSLEGKMLHFNLLL